MMMLLPDGINLRRRRPAPTVDVSALTVQEVVDAVKAGRIGAEDAAEQEQAGRQRVGVLFHLRGMR
jgi:hypothetical protein